MIICEICVKNALNKSKNHVKCIFQTIFRTDAFALLTLAFPYMPFAGEVWDCRLCQC